VPAFRETALTIDPRFNNKPLQELSAMGASHRITIVNANYDIPGGMQSVGFPGSSADALLGIARLIPIEEEVIILRHENQVRDVIEYESGRAFYRADMTLRNQEPPIILKLKNRCQSTADNLFKRPGFYQVISNPYEQHLFVRTIDELPFACCSLVVAHNVADKQA